MSLSHEGSVVKDIFIRGPLLGLRCIVFMALAIILMVLDHRQQYLGTVKKALIKIVMPLQYAAAWPTHMLTITTGEIASYSQLRKENALLIRENLQLNVQLQKFSALIQENDQLRGLLKAASNVKNQKILVAETLAISTDFFSHRLLLNKGSKQGVYKGQAVLDQFGILGQVITTADSSSRVLLLSDAQSAIPVQNYRTGMRGLIIGTGSQNNLALINIPVTTDIKIGDTFISSGLDGKYPPGYPVGTVQLIQHKPQEQFAVVTIKPKSQFNSSQLVVLIWPQAKT